MTIPEIPDEIMREAEAAIERHRSTDGAALSNYTAMRDSICRALLARDQRAAEIAWTQAKQGATADQIRAAILTYDKEQATPVYDDDDYYKPDESGYSRADEEWFFDMDGKP